MSARVFFHGLSELRALAALGVLWHHVELYKKRLDMNSLYDFPHISNVVSTLGENGVDLFFVLSGFLITYLLLTEKENVGKISVRKFYVRRVLRIWPLYLLIVLISFFVVPYVYRLIPEFFEGQLFYNKLIEWLSYGFNLILFLLFMSNFALHFFGPVVGASQSWSVSVEEQFYILWPWVVKIFHKVLIPFLIVLIVFKTGLDWMINSKQIELNKWLVAFVTTFRVEFLAMGALFAKLYKYDNLIFKKVLRNKFFFVVVLILCIYQLHSKFSNIATAISFALLILCFIERKVRIKPLEYLGRISYGIYMYHPLMMYFSFSLAHQLGIFDITALNLFVYPVILFLTIVVSNLSYKYFETFFLRIKENFSPIKSGKI